MVMLSFGGVAVSKDRLDVMILPEEQSFSVNNDAAGWAELVEGLRGFSIAAIGIEASGGYECGVIRALLAGGMSVRQVNPFKLRQFARASGVACQGRPGQPQLANQQSYSRKNVQWERPFISLPRPRCWRLAPARR
jgi:hypothetical protein